MPSSKTVMPETAIMYSSISVSSKEYSDFLTKLRKELRKFLNNNWFQVVMAILLLLSLFLPDSWILGNAPEYTDDVKSGIMLAVFILFMLEFFAVWFAQDGYAFSIFFWLDLIGNLSLLIDISWIADSFIPQSNQANDVSVIRAVRAARLGARYGRLLRLIRILRIARSLNICGRDSKDYEPTMSAIKKVSDDLSLVLSLRVAILVVFLIIIVPFLSYNPADRSYNSWVINFKLAAKNPNMTMSDLEHLAWKCNNFYEPLDSKVKSIYIEDPYLPEFLYVEYDTRSLLRHDNIIEYNSQIYIENSTLANSGNSNAIGYLANSTADGRDSREGFTEFKIQLKFDQTIPAQFNALYSILIIVLVILVLFTFTESFNTAISKLVVMPLEKMLTTLRNSAMVMLKTLKSLETAKDEEEEKKGESKGEDDDEEEEDEELDTLMLEKIVEKLTRIVKHVMPNNEAQVDANIDKTTANWLSQAYSLGTGNKDREVHRADSVITDEAADRLRMKNLEESLSPEIRKQLHSWDFDVLKHPHEDLHKVVFYLFSKLNLLEEFQVPENVFRAFLIELSNRYINSNTYHNYKHGVDVCFTCYRLATIPGLTSVFSALEVFSLLVGALAHDVGHPGLNNVYLIKAKHDLAIRHNDRSPLENMHCTVLYEIASKEGLNIFMGLADKDWREARKTIITIILGTDMSHHFEQISKTQLFNEVNGEDVRSFCAGHKDDIDCFRDDKNRLFVLELILHCSDISNPFKPFDICSAWADLVVEEFCLQGDRERSEGLEISPMCDRATINLYNMQMGFIEFVVSPLIIAFVNTFPPLHEIGQNMLNNFLSWGDKRREEIMRDDKIADKAEECRKLDERLNKFSEKLSFVQNLKEMPLRKRRNSGGSLSV